MTEAIYTMLALTAAAFLVYGALWYAAKMRKGKP
jgi:hypothetical protein